MKIVLIAPCNVRQRWKGKKSSFVWPPMGLLTLAALTPPSFEVRLIDEAVDLFDPDDLECDLAAVSLLTANAPRGYEIADRLRTRGIPVVLGGIHASMLPKEAAEHADAVGVGEGELLWRDMLSDFSSGRGLRPLYEADGFCDPAQIPIPRRDLLRTRAYGMPGTIMATRGCPYNCSFCSTTKFMGNRYRKRPVESVVQDLASIPQRWCIFLDDNLLASPKYARELLAAIRPLRKKWVAQSSMNVAKDTALLDMAAAAGCRGILVGFESLSMENLRDVRKGINKVDEFADAVSAFHRAGIFVQGSFIFGLDGDPPDLFERTFRFVEDTPLEGANYSILTPLPGTDLYNRLEDEGRITERDWSRYDKLNVCFAPKNISPADLIAGVKNIYRRTYAYRSMLRRLPLFRRQGILALFLNLAYRRGVYRGWSDE
jgi:radical SAM superfamily enzyme YgiQ (UPF0313 family)